jgi:hypothetical protein
VDLHNKYPGYFYKRGNLFNTYLNKIDPEAELEESESREARRLEYLRGEHKKSSQEKRGDRLYDFLRTNCTSRDAARFVRRVTRFMEISADTPSDPRIWPILRQLIDHDLTEWQKRHYFEELERRKLHGKPLVRP